MTWHHKNNYKGEVVNILGKKYKHSKAKGFTLIELLVVVAILALLAGIVGPQVMKQLGGSKTKAAKIQIEELSAALEMYKIDTNRYPTTEQTLQALVQQPAGVDGWNGPYLRKNFVPKDPWKNNYNYRYPGRNAEYEIYSLGADGSEGGDKENQDVVSWN